MSLRAHSRSPGIRTGRSGSSGSESRICAERSPARALEAALGSDRDDRHVGPLAGPISDAIAVQQRREDLDEQRQRRASIAERAAERLDRAARVGVEARWIIGRLAVGVAEGPVGQVAPLVAVHPDDPLRGDGGREVSDDRVRSLDRPGHRDRVRRDASVPPSECGHPMARRRAVADREPDESHPCERLRVRADATGVTEVAAAGHRDPGLLDERHHRLDHAHPDDLSEPAPAVDAQAPGGRAGDLGLARRVDRPRPDLLDVLRDTHEPMRGEPHALGGDQVVDDDLGILRPRPGMTEDRPSQRREVLDRDRDRRRLADRRDVTRRHR